MTREEAMKKAYKEALQISAGNSSDSLSRLIDKIYDDFDSRTCGNCEWGIDNVCTNDDTPLCADFVASTFGCNKFERKEK